ncbi:survival motor neuron protein [Leptopilina boulardi]|uniref:survival motor neuron protein n=1 Tax=Leptopilina boulardi TaxID=63433 RepID=UPI0021F551E9|nr:survival motor neuron protein [Leptopilina boulardi]
MEDVNVLFVRGNSKSMSDEDQEDVWDDSALIKAYDKAINLAKEEVAKQMGIQELTPEKSKKSTTPKENRQSRKNQRKWCVGCPCRAVYSEDGELYEAIITKMHENSATCTVRFIGYNNTEEIEFSRLLESEGLQNQIAQQKASMQENDDNEQQSTSTASETSKNFTNLRNLNGILGDKMDCDYTENKSSSSSKKFTPYDRLTDFNLPTAPPAPPLPPHLMSRLPQNDADALSSMLMSWYISGFHTGYYHGLQQAKNSQEKRKK